MTMSDYHTIISHLEYLVDDDKIKRIQMILRWVLVFLLIAILSAVWGFTGIIPVGINTARAVFGVSIVIFVVLLFIHVSNEKEE